MAELKQLEFYLLRYVPIAVREEFVNIGLILIEADHSGFAEVRFAPDWKAAERIDPQADIEMLQAIKRHALGQFQDPATQALFLRKMEDSFSNVIQVSAMSGCLAEDPAKEMEVLASFYFKTVYQPAQRIPSGRTRIWQQMRAAFQRQEILDHLMTDIAMEKYTEAGDTLKLDFAYRVREELKVFQAVSLIGKLDQAKLFGFRATGIVTNLAKHTGAVPFLTAVVDDDWDRNNSEASFVVNTMKENRIEVAVLADVPKIAERARIELQL